MPSQPTSDLAQVREYFQNFGLKQAPETGSPLYHTLCLGVLDDPDMLQLAASCLPSQPSANLLFGAVHYLLLGGELHPLRDFYPDVVAPEKTPRLPSSETYSLFQDFVWSHTDEIKQLITTRLVQTNVVRRTTCLLPVFAFISQEAKSQPLSIIEIGSSAGLNLHWDRYHHRYEYPSGKTIEWGNKDSAVQLSTEVRGTVSLPTLPEDLRVVWRAGVDINPIDVMNADAMRWLRALVFPEHLERHQEIEAAARIVRDNPVPIVTGDALTRLPDLLSQAPDDSRLCLYATMVLYQFSSEARKALWALLAEFSKTRPVSVVIQDGVPEGWAQLLIRDFKDGKYTKRRMAEAHAHGRWLEWRESGEQTKKQ